MYKGGIHINLDIAGITIKVLYDNSYRLEQFEQFYSEYPGNTDLQISLNTCEDINKPDEHAMLNNGINWVCVSDEDDSVYAYICREKSGKIISMLKTDKNWSSASINYCENISKEEWLVSRRLDEILFCNCILFHQGLVMHASAIEWNGKGVMFTAPGETGKSTQANLWKKYMGTKVLNGDRPAVKVLDGQPYVYGTPWSGKSPDFLNSFAPLSAIIVLEQAPENSICRLEKRDSACRLMPRCFLSYYDRRLIDMAMNTLEKIIAATPVYVLKCRPDREAVELVYQCIR